MPKHSKETQENKLTETVKSIIIFVLCISIVFIVILYVCNNLKEKQPKVVINKFFTAIKEENIKSANEFSNYEDLIDSFDTMILQDDSDTSNVKKELFKNMMWTIEEVEIENDRATVIVEVINKNFKNVITKWMKEIVISKSLEKEITNEIALQKLQNILSQESEYKTVIKRIILKNDGEEWKIQVNEELRDLVYPGIDSVIEVLHSN